MFISKLDQQLNQRKVLTDNLAVAYATSGSKLLDMNFNLSSYRNESDDNIRKDFLSAFVEDPLSALRWLFFSRDIRGGMGERRFFRVCFNALAQSEPKLAIALLPLVPEYGRWDDIFCVEGTKAEEAMYALIKKQYLADMQSEGPISLASKWLPSMNSRNKTVAAHARKIADAIGVDHKAYQKNIGYLRTQLKIVEKSMSQGKWGEIDYSAAPSRANLLYRKAFLTRDEERRAQFLESLAEGKETINAGTLFPHDLLARYGCQSAFDPAIEALWKALPDYGEMANTLVVADGSGSMYSNISWTEIQAIHVANALAIYFGERCVGEFKNKYITFSNRPQLVDLGEDTSLLTKIKIASDHDEVSNTNIEAVFQLILRTAIFNNLRQNEMPETILIISDMQFDYAVDDRWTGKALFEHFEEQYSAHGYHIPKLAFWNVMSPAKTIPLQVHPTGLALISGFSPAAIQIAMQRELDPLKSLNNVIYSERYDAVEAALR